MGIIGPGKVIQDIAADEPGIVNLGGGQVSLTAQPFYRLGVNPEAAAGFYHVEIVIQEYHCNPNKYCFIKAIITLISPFVKSLDLLGQKKGQNSIDWNRTYVLLCLCLII